MAGSIYERMKRLMKRSYNVMWVGDHGVGKSEMMLGAAAELGIRVKYFSAATLDPWADLVGVPVPTMDEKQKRRFLEFVRPQDLMDAELWIFDELNRVQSPKIHNAVMEAVQFHSINGEPIKNLRCVWAAINPPDRSKGYQVIAIDKPLLDRFHFTIPVPANPSIDFYVSKGYKQENARTVVKWWKGLDKDLRHDVTPRRLEYMLMAYEDKEPLDNVLPLGVAAPIASLVQALKKAKSDDLISEWDVDNPVKRKKLLKEIQNNPLNMTIQLQVCNLIGDRKFPPVFNYIDLIEAFSPEVRNKFFTHIGHRMKKWAPDPNENAWLKRCGAKSAQENAKRFFSLAIANGVYE